MTRELLNTLFVMTEGAFVRLESDTLRVEVEGEKQMQVPIHHLGSVMLFGTAHMTAPAMHRCAAEGRAVNLMDMNGRFKARVEGPKSGNILLRIAQFDAYRDEAKAVEITRNLLAGKIRNQRALLARAARDTKSNESKDALIVASESLAESVRSLLSYTTLDTLRGVEGQAASTYFDVFSHCLTVPTTEFSFTNRSRRPPRDRTNALLSFLYALLTTDCVAACEGVGLDPQLGFLHALRPGRPSLALDIMEEFRPVLCDRLALSLINRKQLKSTHFEEREGGSVLLAKEGKKIVLNAYQEKKKEEVIHPFLKEKAPIGLLPHLQTRLLARHLRGDATHYLPFLQEN